MPDKLYVCPSAEIADVDLSSLIACSTGREIPIDDAVEADMEFEALSNKNIWNL